MANVGGERVLDLRCAGLIEDQFPWGEWGHSEHTARGGDSEAASLAKPNLFTSTEAAYSLIAAGEGEENIARYLTWAAKLRDDHGFWRNAAGGASPGGPGRVVPSWVRNVRHCAKGLDIGLLFESLRGEDKPVFDWVLAQQRPDGAFPQFPEGSADVWSTAYVLDLLRRCLSGSRHQDAALLFSARREGSEAWIGQLQTRLGRARQWIFD
ncbi:MAG: hypothetical protein QOC82_867 [Frankiaceae bacterium]|jgi:hypothetical protein|nr:hypothetical protein [Frankiaceae bacterium]